MSETSKHSRVEVEVERSVARTWRFKVAHGTPEEMIAEAEHQAREMDWSDVPVEGGGPTFLTTFLDEDLDRAALSSVGAAALMQDLLLCGVKDYDSQRAICEEALEEMAGIQCYDHENLGDLLEAVAVNIGDRTLPRDCLTSIANERNDR